MATPSQRLLPALHDLQHSPGRRGSRYYSVADGRLLKELACPTSRVDTQLLLPPPPAAQAALIADNIAKLNVDKTQVIYNRFQSVIAFKPTVATILSPAALEKRAEEEGGLAFDQYEVEGPDRGELMLDLSEFQLAATLYNAMLENATSELGSRMQSMENSTKNAQDMLARLTLFYNRTRQARARSAAQTLSRAAPRVRFSALRKLLCWR